eukprot:Selendium_serpulae@DN5981_c0_g1_i1.p2
MGCSSSKDSKKEAAPAKSSRSGSSDRPIDKDTHSFKVILVGAKDLPPSDANGLADPFAYFKWREVLRKTAVEYKNLNPVWNAEFDDLLYNPAKDSTTMTVRVLDYDKTSWDDRAGDTKMSDPLGEAEIDLKVLIESASHEETTIARSYNLTIGDGQVEVSITVVKLSTD